MEVGISDRDDFVKWNWVGYIVDYLMGEKRIKENSCF